MSDEDDLRARTEASMRRFNIPHGTALDPTDRDKRIPRNLAKALMEHSPRLVISRPTLIRHAESPTGWLVVIPGDGE